MTNHGRTRGFPEYISEDLKAESIIQTGLQTDVCILKDTFKTEKSARHCLIRRNAGSSIPSIRQAGQDRPRNKSPLATQSGHLRGSMESSIGVLIALRREVRFNSVVLDHSIEPAMWKTGTLWLGIALLASCATSVGVPGEVRSQLAPTGKLRVGLNFGNVLLVSKGQADGDPRGVVVDVAHELGARIGVPVQFIAYERPGLLAEAAKSGDWDIVFFGRRACSRNDDQL